MKHLKHVSKTFTKTPDKTLEKPLQNIRNIKIATPKINTLAIYF
jgi:hypothetical protein